MLTGRNMIGAAAFQTLPPKVCQTCGKTFPVVNMQYAYKLPRPKTGTSFRWYCCYTCFRAAQKPLEDKQRAHREEMERRAEERAERERARKQKGRREEARKPVTKQEKETIAQMIARMKRASTERMKSKAACEAGGKANDRTR